MNAVGNTNAPVYGVAAEFQCARDLYHAAQKIRDAGFENAKYRNLTMGVAALHSGWKI